MASGDDRAHGVTPELREDYATRSVSQQGAFVLPYLHPGMNLLDIGCGPGTITLGLAQAVYPGHVIGVDHDAAHVKVARALVAERGVTNVTFQEGDAVAPQFENGAFDVAFENDLFTHLSQNATLAAREVYRVLKLGKRLPAILRQAGFTRTVKSVSADTKGDAEAVRAHARITIFLLDGPLGRHALANGWADGSTLEHIKAGILAWAEHPDAFFANTYVEVVGWKPGRSGATQACGLGVERLCNRTERVGRSRQRAAITEMVKES